MARLRTLLLLKKLGIEPATSRTPEEQARFIASLDELADRCKMSRRLTMTPSLVAWLWDSEEKLRERARDAVARLREANEKSAQTGSGSRKPEEKSDKQPARKDWLQIAFDILGASPDPEDLIEFKRRLALYGRLCREEAARSGMKFEG